MLALFTSASMVPPFGENPTDCPRDGFIRVGIPRTFLTPESFLPDQHRHPLISRQR
jgi:hypothetical protein